MGDTAQLQTPVLFLIFNRPSTTRIVFESIRSARPRVLYVAGDGPRPGIHADVDRCRETRQIATQIDWNCELHTLFRERNFGIGRGVAAAITWFFRHVPEGIVLEDDCLPDPSFYRFCEELLAFHRNQPAVMHISGNNFQYGRRRGEASYYYSQYTHCWGWASWQRAWRLFDLSLLGADSRPYVWDGEWLLAVRKNKGVAALPNVNLVKNIGFGSDATHTRTPERYAFLAAEEMSFPLRHPAGITIDRRADTLTYYANFRRIRDLRWMWFYEIIDFFRLIPVRARKAWNRLTRNPSGRLLL
jgi:hypothetical protein